MYEHEILCIMNRSEPIKNNRKGDRNSLLKSKREVMKKKPLQANKKESF